VPRLYARIYLHFLGVLFVVGVAASVVFAVGQRSAFQRLVTERMARHVGALAAETLGDPTALDRRVRQLHEDLEVDVTVRDLEGRVLAAAGAPLRPLDGAERAELAAGRPVSRGGPVWFVAAPMRAPDGQAVAGVIEVSTPRRLRSAVWWRPGLTVALVLLIVGLAAAPLARRISRPLERLTEAARRLGRGELSYRVPLDGVGRWRRHRRVDELRELTTAFNDMAERVERLVAGQKELLANVSHELRSPLARIRVALALLPADGASGPRIAEVERDLAELERLIDDVLTTTRLEATGRPPSVAPVDVPALLAGVAARAAHDPATAGRAVRVSDGPALVLEADGALLRRALWNLVENAAKYGAPPITLDARRDGDRVELAVTDAGPGIPVAERERVLAPFYRGDRARTPASDAASPPGFGLGLTLVGRIAEAHGGRITIEPAASSGDGEHGCRVTLVLPARPARPA
jgi:signal transduction histidine kinase